MTGIGSFSTATDIGKTAYVCGVIGRSSDHAFAALTALVEGAEQAWRRRRFTRAKIG
jgi:hypothetical protein